jgi:hypothetical protein
MILNSDEIVSFVLNLLLIIPKNTLKYFPHSLLKQLKTKTFIVVLIFDESVLKMFLFKFA